MRYSLFIIYFALCYYNFIMYKKFPIISLFILAIFSCNTDKIAIEGFDNVTWKADNYGCDNLRVNQLSLIKSNATTLLSRTQHEIKDFLGSPDEHELYERTRKFFYYYLEPSAKCSDSLNIKPKILQIRFSAMGISNEVFIKNE